MKRFLANLVAGLFGLSSAAFAAQGGIPVCTVNLNQCTTNLTQCNGTLTTCATQLITAQACGNGVTDPGEDCDQSNLNGKTCMTLIPGFAGGVLKCGAGCEFDTSGCQADRFHDNGDGTITDYQTGKMWEQKTGTVGSEVQCSLSSGGCADPHNVNNTYTWNGYDPSAPSVEAQTPTGTAFTDFLYRLNSCTSGDTSNTDGFAGHCDWRLPTKQELEELLLPQDQCTAESVPSQSQCTYDALQPTAAGLYWSVTTDSGPTEDSGVVPVIAWCANFGLGGMQGLFKPNREYVRAVRTP